MQNTPSIRKLTNAPTLVDVARAAGVSVSTAGRSLRDTGWPVDAVLKERVRAAADSLGYVPNMLARTLRAGAPALIGLVAGNMLDPYYGEIAEAVTRHAEASHTMLAMVCNMQRDPVLELKHCRQLWEHRVAGLILAGGGFDQNTHDAEFKSTLDQMARSGVVIATLSPRGINAPEFCVDNTEVGRMAATTLIQQGHRHIGIVIGPLLNDVRRQRLRGMIAALEKAKAVFYIAEPEPSDSQDPSVERLLKKHSNITGMIAGSHMISMRIINNVRGTGRKVPDDISIVGIGNSKLVDWSAPKMTHIDLDLDACGRAALDHIAEMFVGREPAERITRLPRLVPGESIATLK